MNDMEFSAAVYLNENINNVMLTVESLIKNNVKDIFILNPNALNRNLAIQLYHKFCQVDYTLDDFVNNNFILMFSGEILEKIEKSTSSTVYMEYKEKIFQVKRIISFPKSCINFYIKTPNQFRLEKFNNENDLIVSMILSKRLASKNTHTCAMEIISNSNDKNLISDTYCFIADTQNDEFMAECIFNSLTYRACNPKAWELLGDWWYNRVSLKKAKKSYEVALFMLKKIQSFSSLFYILNINENILKQKIELIKKEDT